MNEPSNTTTTHHLPSSCHVCGTPVPNREGATRPDCWHDLTNAEAFAAADEHDRRTSVVYPSMTAVETLDPREAVSA